MRLAAGYHERIIRRIITKLKRFIPGPAIVLATVRGREEARVREGSDVNRVAVSRWSAAVGMGRWDIRTGFRCPWTRG